MKEEKNGHVSCPKKEQCRVKSRVGFAEALPGSCLSCSNTDKGKQMGGRQCGGDNFGRGR